MECVGVKRARPGLGVSLVMSQIQLCFPSQEVCHFLHFFGLSLYSLEQRVLTPVEIVSIRAGEVYTENEDPVNGHRLLIQALVKFDTTQVSRPSFTESVAGVETEFTSRKLIFWTNMDEK